MNVPPVEQQQQYWLWIPITVSICALAVTVISFWWLNARQGKLKVYEPHSFGAMGSGSVFLSLTFPLVLHNTGPKPIIVQDFLLRFLDESNSIIPLTWRASHSELRLHQGDGQKFPAVFAVPGRGAEQHFIEFGGPLPGFTFGGRNYRVQIATKLGHRSGWTTLLEFTLRAAQISDRSDYVIYRNSIPDLSKEDEIKFSNALDKLMLLLRKQKNSDKTDG